MTNPNLDKLHSYPFQKLNKIKSDLKPNTSLEHIALSVGEPKHKPPQFVLDTLTKNINKLSQYPSTIGLPELRQAISAWATQRFELTQGTLTAAHHVLPVNGTREALFAFTQAVVDPNKQPLVISPNPFYQIYEGASLLASAELKLLNCTSKTNYLPDFDSISEQEWQRCQLLFLCSPGNPTGEILSSDDYKKIISLADKYDFVIASDECYSEIYKHEENPPAGLLQACAEMGRFHSLSKRSNLPGLRSGFVAGDSSLIKKFLLFRTYHGCAMSVPIQLASIAAWGDEQHVKSNRDLSSFYLWAKTPINDVEFAKQLFAEQHITVLPGSFLSRDSEAKNPGENYVRMALVASVEECREAANRLKAFIQKNF